MLLDTWLVFKRGFQLSLRTPVWVLVGLMQPLLYLFLFGPLLHGVTKAPGFPEGTSWQILTPAMLVLLGLFGSAFVGFGLISEWRGGVLDRMRVTPASRAALLLGRALVAAVQMMVQGALLVLVAVLVFGLRAPIGGVLLSLLIVGLLGVTMASFSYALALLIKVEEAFGPLMNTLVLPIMLLSGILIPVTTVLAPQWLYAISRVNPLSYVVEAERAAFLGDYGSRSLLVGILVLLAVGCLTVWWGIRMFQRESS
ncbi:ABC transporter permease [Nocardia sp. NPDC060256]|uniref:ABC transporter permease n=1 Tax=unclassified Nocardia TaxID=2637762 RepID=UPI00364EA73A